MHILLALQLSYIYYYNIEYISLSYIYHYYIPYSTYTIHMYLPLFLDMASNSSNTSTCKALRIPIIYSV